MIDVLLNTAKFAASDDARKSVLAVVDWIKSSPEWKKDVCSLKAKVERTHKEHAVLLADLSTEKIEQLDYTQEGIRAFRSCFNELVTNAFEHGCKLGGTIAIDIEISRSYASFSVENSRGIRFDFQKSFRDTFQALTIQPRRKRGRGLALVNNLADSLEVLPPSGIKAVIYRDRFSSDQFSYNGISIITILSGIDNPSLNRRMNQQVLAALQSSDTILDLTRFYSIDTRVGGEAIELDENARSIGRKFLLKLHPDDSNLQRLFSSAGLRVVLSWSKALRELGMEDQVKRLLSVLNERDPRYLVKEKPFTE
ncbi:MAG: ATP-binding protein [Terracidiphilus sp.]